MSHNPLVFLTFALVVAGALYFTKRRLPPPGEQKELANTLPWWFYIGIGLSGVLALGPFNDSVDSVGWILFALVAGLRFNWKQRGNK